MDKPEAGRIIWGNFTDTRGRLVGPHRAIIITKNDEIDADKPIRVVVISSNLQMAAKEDMVLLPYLACEAGHVYTRLKTKCAAICTWIPTISKEDITEYGGGVRGKYFAQIMKRVDDLDGPPKK